MAYQEVLVTDSLDAGRQKYNANFEELYAINIVPVTGAISLTSSAMGKIHVCTGTATDYTIDLPTAVGNEGVIIFKGAAALTKVVTIQGTSGQTLDGETERKIAAGGMISLLSDGANWIVVNEVGSWIPYTPVLTGFSTDPTVSRCAYFRTGKMVQVSFVTSGSGVSNATTKTISVPFNSDIVSATGVTTAVINNGAAATTGGLISTRAGSNTVDIFRDLSAASWTASGNCRFSFNMTYKIA